MSAFPLLCAGSVMADSLAGEDQILCSLVLTTVCNEDGDCESGPPWIWDVPQFIVYDLDDEEIRTTEASGENRSTPILNIVRGDGEIAVQGYERGRAFSTVMNEDDGHFSAAIALDGLVISAFGACTPTSD